MHRLARLGIACAATGGLLLGLAACGSPAPLAPQPGTGSVCVQPSPLNTYTFGTLQLSNRSAGELTIQSVRLTDAHNLRVIGARISPTTGPHAVSPAVVPGYPPVNAGYARTMPAADSRVPAHTAGHPWTLWVGVRVLHPGSPASAQGITVHYDGLGAVWTLHGGEALGVGTGPGC